MSKFQGNFKRKYMMDNQQSNHYFSPPHKTPRYGANWPNNQGYSQRSNDFSNRSNFKQSRSHGQFQSTYEYFLVLHFETVKFSNDLEEIVEVVLIKVNPWNSNTDLFHEYVKPVNPLDPQICKLPKMPNAEMSSFPEVLQKMDRWLTQNQCGDNSVFVTWGSFFLGKLLAAQCQISNCQSFDYFNEWIDIKKICAAYFRNGKISISEVANEFRIPRNDSSGKSMAQTVADITLRLTDDPTILKVNAQNNKRRDRSVQRPNIQPKEQLFDYFLVLDFEATCIKDQQINPQEIIEIPTVVVNARTFEKEAEFHEYVKPIAHPELSKFCTELTGIEQKTVDEAEPFIDVIKRYCQWIDKYQGKRIAFVTCGDWDLKTMIGFQCRLVKMPVPKFFKSWINIKNVFQDALKQNRAPGMMGMLDKLGIKHEGHHHSGIDDCRNIANILIELMRYYGAQPDITFNINKPDMTDYARSSFEDAPQRKGLMVKKTQWFEYFLVLDFEATCLENPQRINPQEIIEFPVLKVNANSLRTESEFHEYVRPIAIPKLTPFCTELTGITQEQVDQAKDFKTVLNKFNEWMKDEGLLENRCKFAFVTMGDWDLKTMIAQQCQVSDIPIPEYFNSWINLKLLFTAATKSKKVDDLHDMMEHLNLTFEGKLHSGIDDCRNIAKILSALINEHSALARITYDCKKKPRPKLEKKEIEKEDTDDNLRTSFESAKPEKKENEKKSANDNVKTSVESAKPEKKENEKKSANDNVKTSVESAKPEKKENEKKGDNLKTSAGPIQQNQASPEIPPNNESCIEKNECNTDVVAESKHVSGKTGNNNKKKKNKSKNKGKKGLAFDIEEVSQEALKPFT